MGWNRIIIDVDYWPADPGCSDVYTKRSIVNRKVLEVGKTICYDDPSDIMPIPNHIKDEMEPTVLVIHPNAYTEYLQVDLSKFFFMDPFPEIGRLIHAKDTRSFSAGPLWDITKAVNLENERSLTMFYDIDAEKKGLKVNPVATKLSGGREMCGTVIIALEGDFQPMDCNDSGFRPYYSFTYYDDIEAVFDEIYDFMDGQLYSDDDHEDDDGRFDAHV